MTIRELLVQLLSVLVQLVIVFLGGYALRYLEIAKARMESKIGKEYYDFIYTSAKILVQSVEQKFPNLIGKQKYDLVFKKLNERFGNFLTEEEIDEIIESAVQEMNYIKKNYKKGE